MTDLFLRSGVLIAMDAERRVIPDGALSITNGRIVAAAHANPAQVIEARGKAILRG